MPFTPHTEDDIQEMLAAIGEQQVEALFDEIPASLRVKELTDIPLGVNEQTLAREMTERAAQDDGQLNFIGAGCYHHHIPAAVWELVGRGEFMTAYTPYQAEASQGGLQLIYEYQTMMASLMALDISNASLYDGATALAESILMCVRANRKSKLKQVLVVGELSPSYLGTVKTITQHQGIMVETVSTFNQSPAEIKAAMASYQEEDLAAVVIVQPTFLGQVQTPDFIVDWAHAKNALVIGVVNPTAMALLKPPGQWGSAGVDVACGEGQPLGIPMASGGPFFGFMCCRQAIVRQMPGRIVGKSTDLEGKPGFCLTLQAREQHIRRSKATSNICTNQGLLVTAATIYMSLLGPEGLKRVAQASHANTQLLKEKLLQANVPVLSQGPCFHELVIGCKQPVEKVLTTLARQDIQAGFDLSQAFPELGDALLICCTELHTEDDLDKLVAALALENQLQKPKEESVC